jgi:hypothetical protein
LTREKHQQISEYLPKKALMTMWTAEHLGVSPASKTIHALNEWQIGLMYEVAMSYPIEGLRKSFFERKNSVESVDDDDLLELGLSPDVIAKIKGN